LLRTNFYWARDFNLKDFGISKEEFTITSGQVAVNGTAWELLNLIFIKLMPASFSETDLISSQVINLPPAGQ
jgi:hypothetical protein